MRCAQNSLRWLAALCFVVAGTLHFLKPELYLQIMPPYLPAPKLLVAVSGASEIAGGIGLLMPSSRHLAGWGLIALLIAVLPANIYMLQQAGSSHLSPWILWARLPLQGVFIAWVWFIAIKQASLQQPNSGTL